MQTIDLQLPYPDRHTADGGQKVQWPKRCGNTNRDENNSRHVNNEKTHPQNFKPKKLC